MSLSDSPTAQPLALVRPADLYELFDQVAGVYAFTSCAYLGRPNDSPNPAMDQEHLVRISGAVNAVVVLRASLGAARLLADGLRSDGHASDSEAADALRELCNLFVGHLLTSCLGGHRRAFDPFLPVPSTARDWPAQEPVAACALLIETEPVEIRYWQERAS